ncbi:WD40-repeat-containing domain protein [Lentinula raphanica]|nr:WD40-repeat-containing domain protein [Lentinula raphanica]
MLLTHVTSLTGSFIRDFNALDPTDSIPLAKRLPQNAEDLRRIILEVQGIHEQIVENPLLKQGIMSQIGALHITQSRELWLNNQSLEAAYSEGASRSRSISQDEAIRLFLLPKRRQMRRLLTAALNVERFLESTPTVQPFSIPPKTHQDTSRTPVPALHPTTSATLHNKESGGDQALVNIEGHLQNLSCNTSFDDLMSNFLNAKEQKLQKVLKVIQQFKDDGEIFALQFEQARGKLQARRDHLQHILPSHSADMLDSLAFGRAQTTGYIEDLWTLALRLLPLQDSTSAEQMKIQVLDQLRSFDDSTGLKVTDSIHSSFMMEIDSEYSEMRNRPIPVTEQHQEATDAEELAQAGEAPLRPEDNEVDFTLGNNSIEEAISSPYNARHESRLTPVESVVAANSQSTLAIQHAVRLFETILTWIASFASSGRVPSPPITTGFSRVQHWTFWKANLHEAISTFSVDFVPMQTVQHTAYLLEVFISWIASFAHSTRMRIILITTELGSVRLWNLVTLRQSMAVSYQIALEFRLMQAVQHAPHSLEVILSWIASFACSIRMQISSTATEFSRVRQWNTWKVTRRHWLNVLAFFLKYSTIIKQFLLVAGIVLVLVKLNSFFQMPSKWRQEMHFTVGKAASINTIAVSKDANYLAVAYGTCVDIWDIRTMISNAPLVRYSPDLETRPISFLAWSPEGRRLAVCYEGGLVCVIAMIVDAIELSALAVGFRLSGQAQRSSLRVFSAFLSEDILVVAMGKDVEIREFLNNDGDPRWVLLQLLPASSKSFASGNDDVDIESINSISMNQILVSHNNRITNLWRLERLNDANLFVYMHETTMVVPGDIMDVSPAKGTILVTAAGTYQVLLIGSNTAQNIFIPRDPVTSHPQTASCAKYLSDDLIIGAGEGQLILWNADHGNRLQNLPSQDLEGRMYSLHVNPFQPDQKEIRDWFSSDHSSYVSTLLSFPQTAYRADEDSGWIVTAHDEGRIICWKTVDTIDIVT